MNKELAGSWGGQWFSVVDTDLGDPVCCLLGLDKTGRNDKTKHSSHSPSLTKIGWGGVSMERNEMQILSEEVKISPHTAC